MVVSLTKMGLPWSAAAMNVTICFVALLHNIPANAAHAQTEIVRILPQAIHDRVDNGIRRICSSR